MTRKPKGKPADPYALPPPIPTTAKNLARILMDTPPRKAEDWKFMQAREKAARREAK